MTDRELQDYFDRNDHPDGPSGKARGDAGANDPLDATSLPSGADRTDAEAYRLVYSVLSEPPPGELPADFADRVADRVDLRPATAEDRLSWPEAAGVAVMLIGFVITTLLIPSLSTLLQETLDATVQSLRPLTEIVRIDVLALAGLSLLFALLTDRLVQRLAPYVHLRRGVGR